jgi:hypothetical protein
MSRTLGLLLAIGSSSTAAAADLAPTAPEAELLRQLSLRDGSPPCAELEAGLPDAVASLKAVVANVSMPPWAPMRAAECLIAGHSASVRGDLVAWVTEPGLKGLGLLALNKLDAMPTDVAVEVARAAVERGPDPAAARVRVARASEPTVAAVAAVNE